MARYWVGGTGLWNDTSKWSDVDGGTGGKSVPTSTDDVYFTANSFSVDGATVTLNTVANCLSMNWVSITKTVTLTSSVNSLNVYGDLTLSNKLTWTFTSTAYLYSKSVSDRGITSNGCTPALNAWYINNSTNINTRLLDDMTISGTIYPTTGVFNTNNFNLTGKFINSSVPANASINFNGGKISLGSSIITINYIYSHFGSGSILDAGTSTIITYGGGGSGFYGAGHTFYNVIVYGNFISDGASSNSGPIVFNNLTINKGVNYKSPSIGSAVSQTRTVTVNGILTLNGNASSNRIIVNTDITSLSKIFCSNVVSNYTDWKDTVFATQVDLSNAVGGSGDLGGNSNIIFSTPTNCYYKSSTATNLWSDTSKWVTTSGGSTLSRIPLPQDTAIIDNNSFTSTSNTLTINYATNVGTLNTSGLNSTNSVNIVNTVYNLGLYGDLLLSNKTSISFSGTGYLYWNKSGTITTNTCVPQFNRLYMNLVGGTFQHGDNANLDGSNIYLVNGTWKTNGYNITTTGIIQNEVGNKTFDFVNSTISCGTLFNQAYSNGQNTNVYASGSNIICKNFNTYFSTNSYNNVVAEAVGLSGVGFNSFNNLTISPTSSTPNSYMLFINYGLSVTGTLTINGLPNKRVLIYSNGMNRLNITAANYNISYADFRDINITNGPLDLSNIPGGAGDCGGNTNIIFTPSQTQYYKHTSGTTCNWSDSTKWFTATNGGGSQGRIPLPQDDAIFDANSFSSSGVTLTVDVDRLCKNLDMSGVNYTFSYLISRNHEIYGNYVLSNNLLPNINGITHLLARSGNYTINTFNKAHAQIQWSQNGNFDNLSDMNVTALGLTGFGTFNMNNYAINCGFIAFNNGTPTVNLNGSILNVRGHGATAGYGLFGNSKETINAGSSTINMLQTSGNYNYSIVLKNGTVLNNVIVVTSTNTGYVTWGANASSTMTINNLTLQPGVKFNSIAGSTLTIGKLTAVGTPSQRITISSTTAAQHILTQTVGSSETNTVDYCDISYSKTLNGVWNAGDNSQDLGNNSGWEFGFTPIVMWY